MKTIFDRCSELAHIAGKRRATLSIILLGVSSTLWFLIRVVPKPSRATYPCMQAASPIMSGFVLWLLGLTGSAAAFKRANGKLREAKYAAAILFVVLGLILANHSIESDARTNANSLEIW